MLVTNFSKFWCTHFLYLVLAQKKDKVIIPIFKRTLLHKWLVVPVANPLFVPVLEPGQGFRDKSLEAFVPGGRTGTKGA